MLGPKRFLPSFQRVETPPPDKVQIDEALVATLSTFTDYSKLQCLTVTEIIREAAKHPIIVDYIAKEKDSFVLSLDNWDLIYIGIENEKFARKVVTDPALRQIVEFENLHLFGQCHLNIAHLLIDTPEYCDQLTVDDLSRMADRHHEIALKIRRRQDLLDKIGENVAQLGYHHEDIAQSIYESKELRARMRNSNIMAVCSLGAKHPKIAKQILEQYGQYLNGQDLMILGGTPEIAMLILTSPHYDQKLDNFERAALGKISEEATNLVLENPTMKAMEFLILGDRESTAMKIITTQKLASKLEVADYVILGTKHLKAAEWILDNPKLSLELNGEQLADLGFYHPTLIPKILRNPKLFAKLSGHNLSFMHAKKTASKDTLDFLNNPAAIELLKEDSVSGLGWLAENHYDFADKVFANKDLVGFVPPYLYPSVGRRIGMAQRILSDETLTDKLEPSAIAKMKLDVKIATTMHEMAKGLQNDLVSSPQAKRRMRIGV